MFAVAPAVADAIRQAFQEHGRGQHRPARRTPKGVAIIDVTSIVRSALIPGSYLQIGRARFILHYDDIRVSHGDPGCDDLKQAAIKAGLPIMDSRPVPFEGDAGAVSMAVEDARHHNACALGDPAHRSHQLKRPSPETEGEEPRDEAATASAGRATRVRRRRSRAARALVPRPARGRAEAFREEECRKMSGNDAELEELRAVNCSALLERLPPPWQLDKAESTKRCLQYRRGKGEIILVTHEGRGWWDPGSTTARGDVFNLVQHLQPGTAFGQVCKLLREFVGIAPS